MKKIIFLGAFLLFCGVANSQSVDLKSLLQQELSSDTTAKYDNVFSELDADKNGVLSETELLKFQQSGLAGEKDETLRVFDTDGDGQITKEEYISFYNKQSPQNTDSTALMQNFKDIDTDENGLISSEELKTYRIRNLNTQNSEIFKIMDSNQDNEVSKEEFGDFMSFTNSILNNFYDF